jgi:hypothetical protein
MTVVFVYSKRNQEATTLAYFDYVLAAMQANGALVLEESRFMASGKDMLVPHGDRLVNFYCDNPAAVWQRCLPQFRWNYAIDEIAQPDGRAYATKIKQCKENDCTKMVVTYMSPRHLLNLRQAGISYVGMPCCPPRIRTRVSKPRAVAAFGSYHPTTYPERTRIKEALVRSFGAQHVHEHLNPPATGERFYEALDGYQMGIVDRAGFRDRFVNKYVEFGASHVLPIGDCPSYMPRDMREAMVNTEGKNAKWIISEVNRLLHTPQELMLRQENYTEAVSKNFNLLQHAGRVVQTITAA